MKRNLLIVPILLLVLLTACSAPEAEKEEDELHKTLSRVEQALEDVLDDPQKRAVTEVLQFPFSDPDGNIMIFHYCLTTYYAQDPSTVTGLNMDAISAVFDPDSAILLEEFTVEGHSAAIYQANEWNYACWTSTPEESGIMQYDPDVVSWEDIHRIVESVYIPPQD